MKIEEAYKCPGCGQTDVYVSDIQQLFEDARVETVGCVVCNSQWKVYYKMQELKVEPINITPPLAQDEITETIRIEQTESDSIDNLDFSTNNN